jgi:hypothetical protein
MSVIWQEHQIEKDLDRRWALHIAKQYPILQQTKRLESRNKPTRWNLWTLGVVIASCLFWGEVIIRWHPWR